MSLFETRDLWGFSPDGAAEEECDAGLVVVGNLDNDRAPSPPAKIALGSFHGTLRVFVPRRNESAEFVPEHLVLEQNMGQPLIALALGRFQP